MVSRVTQRVDQVPTGDITAVVAGAGLAGGGVTGSVTLTVDTDALGDLIVGTGADTATKLTVGTNTYVLTADSTTASGLIWSSPTTGDITGVTAGTGLTGGGTSGSVTLAVDPSLATVEDTTTARTLALVDNSRLIRMNNAGATAVTVPPNSSVAFPVGSQVILSAMGAGAVTVTAGAGVTLRSKDAALAIDGQYATASCVKVATDEWIVFGALA
jgi:hypothetical protein